MGNHHDPDELLAIEHPKHQKSVYLWSLLLNLGVVGLAAFLFLIWR